MQNGSKHGTKTEKSPTAPARWATQHEQIGFPANPRYNDATIIAKVAALPSFDAKELRILRRGAPGKRRDHLIPRPAWRIQECAKGGLTDKAKERLEQLMRMKELKKQKNEPKRLNRPAVGTRLVRDHNGVEHHVKVTRNGFEYQGRTFRNLSQIARKITGSPWSGPQFFGLVQKEKGAMKRSRKASATGTTA